MKLSSWWWDFADRCDMKVSSWVLALFLVSAPVVTCGSASADRGSADCKSEDTQAPNRSAPVGLLTAPEPTADCSGAYCKTSEDSTTTYPDRRRAPPVDQTAPAAFILYLPLPPVR